MQNWFTLQKKNFGVVSNYKLMYIMILQKKNFGLVSNNILFIKSVLWEFCRSSPQATSRSGSAVIGPNYVRESRNLKKPYDSTSVIYHCSPGAEFQYWLCIVLTYYAGESQVWNQHNPSLSRTQAK